MNDVRIYKIAMSSPDDMSELDKLIKSGEIQAEEVVAVLAKTEGNGCVNDFTRGFSTFAFKHYLAAKLNVTTEKIEEKVAFVMSGGTEGVMTPHAMIFTKKQSSELTSIVEKALTAEIGFTRDFLPEEIGTRIMVDEVKKTVRQLIELSGITGKEDVHFVQIKCPLLTSDRIEEAKRRGQKVIVDDTYKSMGYSRGASALGVAVALGEVADDAVTDEAILSDWSLFSSVASTSAGVELMNCEIILMGNSVHSVSPYRIGHSVMQDAIDIDSVLQAIKDGGLDIQGLPSCADQKRIVNVLAKAEASPDGKVRERRNTMLTDSDINHTRQARAVVNGVIASVVGDPMVYVSGGAEHQGPAGGGPIAVIIER
ncbi:cyanuric acid amidohydrolase [Amphibacillus marinus]|uniref:Cyanuric acid amidohydrolase n=1 Tax=Amphibacillus marinus TaxID=872970 RepID=A0A1H8GZW9_9BACI|nr:ring-opening amidohydrolase [Amphibacillus marinus]SEN49425.1 cyanuric acid amidohydrolase [Amphibacillus marinus]